MAEFAIHAMRDCEIPAAASLSLAAFGREAWKEKDLQEALDGGHARIYAAVVSDGYSASGNDGTVLSSGALAGYAVFYSAADEGELNSIAVGSSFRRSGAATALLEAAVRDLVAAGVTKIFLEVREHNAPAISFYEKQGFLAAGVRKHFYDAPEEDAIVMVKTLTD